MGETLHLEQPCNLYVYTSLEWHEGPTIVPLFPSWPILLGTAIGLGIRNKRRSDALTPRWHILPGYQRFGLTDRRFIFNGTGGNHSLWHKAIMGFFLDDDGDLQFALEGSRMSLRTPNPQRILDMWRVLTMRDLHHMVAIPHAPPLPTKRSDPEPQPDPATTAAIQRWLTGRMRQAAVALAVCTPTTEGSDQRVGRTVNQVQQMGIECGHFGTNSDAMVLALERCGFRESRDSRSISIFINSTLASRVPYVGNDVEDLLAVDLLDMGCEITSTGTISNVRKWPSRRFDYAWEDLLRKSVDSRVSLVVLFWPEGKDGIPLDVAEALSGFSDCMTEIADLNRSDMRPVVEAYGISGIRTLIVLQDGAVVLKRLVRGKKDVIDCISEMKGSM